MNANAKKASQTPMPSTSTRPAIQSGASWIASAPPEVQTTFLNELDEHALLALPYLFEFWAFPHQLPPEGDWRTWVIMGGRGAGKTRAGSEWVRSQVEGPRPLDKGPARNVALVGETIEQAREVMIFGDSGILACSPPDRRPKWEATRKRLVWPNGAVATIFSAHDPESLRGPQFDAAWLDEVGCPSVDKGANAPNRFFDPKSSESALPPYSNGRRDDTIQMQFLMAQLGYWEDPAKNPISPVYGDRMIDTDYSFVWSWDARPFPFFPNNLALWSDGGNYGRGHWLNGRTSSRALASVVAEICTASGITAFDVTGLYGVVRGFSTSDIGTGRAALQALMLAYGFDALEQAGSLVFRMRTGRLTGHVGDADLAETEEVPGTVERVRSPEAETVGRVRVVGIEAEGAYQIRSSEAIFPDETGQSVTQSDLPLLLTDAETRSIAERWLIEARAARDSVRFSFPPSRTSISVGDVVTVGDGGAPARYRVDKVEQAGLQIAEAVRVDTEIYEPQPDDDGSTGLPPAAFVAPVPVDAVYLDLPLITGSEVEHAPHIAVAAEPWPGSVAVYKSGSASNFVLNTEVLAATAMGVTETDLVAARPGVFDRGAPLRVRMYGGTLDAVTEAEVLNGANAVAIGDGQSDLWEVFQFQTATLVGVDLYDLTLRLRGQLGTDAVMPGVWPAGSVVVPLSTTLTQLDLATSERGLARTYRVGPSARPVDDAIFVETARAFDGIGLRPYAPVHLRARSDGAGGQVLSWIRRTRIDGDPWVGLDVPLGETAESYLVRVTEGGAIRREAVVAQPAWTYTQAEIAADAITGSYDIEIAQISDRFGPGPFGRISLDV